MAWNSLSFLAPLTPPKIAILIFSQPTRRLQKNTHIPRPYETPLPTAVTFSDSDLTRPSPPPDPLFSNPVVFGDPLDVGGGQDRRHSLVVAVPEVVSIPFETIFIR